MGAFWKNVGKGFAAVGKGLIVAGTWGLKGAQWASQHPEVLAAVLAAAKVPANVAQPIETGVEIAGQISPR